MVGLDFIICTKLEIFIKNQLYEYFGTNSSSAAQKLNLYFINENINTNGTLLCRVKNICNSFNLKFPNCILNDMNLRDTFYKFPKCGEDGLVDSLRRLLYATEADRELIKLLLRSF